MKKKWAKRLKIKLARMRKRPANWKRSAIIGSTAFMLAFFQNCGPVGDSNSASSNGDLNGSVGGVGGTGGVGGGGTTPPPGGGGTTPPPPGGGGGTTPPPVTNSPPAPNPTNLASPANGNNNITLTWVSGGGSTTAYRVVWQEGASAPANCSGGGAMTVASTTASVTGLTRGRQYSFRVCALNGNTVPDASSGATYTWGTRCYQNQAPNIVTSTFNNFGFPMGMGPLSGTAGNIANVAVQGSNAGGPYDTNQTYSLRCSTSPANIVDMNCDGNNGTDFNNNNVNMTFQQGDTECPTSGPVTVTIRARDECGSESAARTFTINVTNECLAESKVSAAAKEQNDQFGSQVAIDGNYAVVIETGDNEGGSNAGAASVYFYNGSSWSLQQKLIPTEAVAQDNMKSVSISGNRIAVGSPYHPTAGVGAVFIFERSGSTWSQTARITPSEANVQDVGDLFGYSVSLSGSTLVVGAPWDNNFETTGSKLAYAGAVYVYQLSGSNWVQDGAKVVVNGNTGRNEFGASVAYGGTFIAVGAPHNETFRSNGPGRVYILTKSGSNWVAGSAIESSNKKNGDMFGAWVATDGTRVAVGAPFAAGRNGQNSAGSAYILENSSGWSEARRVFASDGANGDRFGASVALAGDNLIVGSPWDDTKTGAAYHFKRSGTNWNQFFKMMARDRAVEDRFAESVAISGGRAICGSRLDDGGVNAQNVGASYILTLK
ncbi:MAG: fibronectin type III domain-containing protein [Bdellovibrionaceae bacterium]|nr:fibronectin type III domain-containing protein [Bdellovibrionales bacterium]MCB9085650.1 fibronectin type III domain-containing protein [Pseudobdellovibrionaceae bacterium]